MASNSIEREGALRAADDDRQRVVDRLRVALNEGRLTLTEYDERVGEAYSARTYSDLYALLDDLPTQPGVVALPPHNPPVPAFVERPAQKLPTALMILWTVWAGVVGVNLVVWFLVMVTTGGNIYPWPVWVAGPSGAALAAATVGVQVIRRHRDA